MYGTELVIGTESLWALALEPVDEATPVVAPTITRGREPLRASEIALGDLTLRRLGLQIGDEVPVAASAAGATSQPHIIVGTAVINATDEGSPGLGAVLSPEGILGVAPGTAVTNFVVDVASGDPGRAALADLEAASGPSCRARSSSRPCATSTASARSRGCWPASSPPSPPEVWPTRSSSSSGATAGSSRC